MRVIGCGNGVVMDTYWNIWSLLVLKLLRGPILILILIRPGRDAIDTEEGLGGDTTDAEGPGGE